MDDAWINFITLGAGVSGGVKGDSSTAEIWRLIYVGVGAVFTGVVTLFVQWIHFMRQRKWDHEKQEIQHRQQMEIMEKQSKQQMEILQSQFVRDQWDRKIAAYNKILDVDHGMSVIYFDNDKNHSIFNEEVYKEFVRPLLYEHFHLLEVGIASSVYRIDSIFDFYKTAQIEILRSDIEILISEYNNIINSIQEVIYKYRDTLSIIKK